MNCTTFPCGGEEGKTPLVKWGQLQAGEQLPIGPGENTGIATGRRSGIFVIDCDDEDSALWYLNTFKPADTYTVRTKRGYHFYYRQPDFDVKNSAGELHEHVDVRGEGGYVLGIPSDGKTVEIDMPVAEAPALLLLHPALRKQDRVSTNLAPVPVDPDSPEGHRRLLKAKDWLRSQPPCISGQGGQVQLWNVCLHLIRKMELPLATSEALLEDYNSRCLPPWSGEEIRHKLEDARDKSDMVPGTAPEDFGKKLRPSKPKKNVDDVPAPAGGEPRAMSYGTLVGVLNAHPDWEGVLCYNVLKRRPQAVRRGENQPPVPLSMERYNFTEADVGSIMIWLESQGYKAGAEDIKRAVANVCQLPGHEHNPVVEYLDSLPVPDDGICELDRVHETILNSPDGPMASRIFKKQLIAAVKRVRAVPGRNEKLAAVDHRVVVVLDGPQECGKSSLIRLLAGEWYNSLRGDVHDADVRVNLQGSWLVEMEEMLTAKKADRDALKAFISATVDNDRAKYAPSAEAVQRSYVLFGTSNETTFDDPTGAARFAAIRVTKMNQANAERLVHRLWSEANQLALAGADHYLDAEEKAFAAGRAQEFEREDPLSDKLKEQLAGIAFITLREAYEIVMGADSEKVVPRMEELRFCDALRRIGCERKKLQDKKGWLVPAEIARQPRLASVTQWLRDAGASKVRDRLVVN